LLQNGELHLLRSKVRIDEKSEKTTFQKIGGRAPIHILGDRLTLELQIWYEGSLK